MVTRLKGLEGQKKGGFLNFECSVVFALMVLLYHFRRGFLNFCQVILTYSVRISICISKAFENDISFNHIYKTFFFKLVMVMHTCKSSAREAEAGGLCARGQPGLRKVNLFKTKHQFQL